MKTTTRYEIGDKVIVEAAREYGVTTNNAQGGMASVPVGKPFLATIVRGWHDYEIGQRYVAETEDGRKLYFGEFGCKVKMAA